MKWIAVWLMVLCVPATAAELPAEQRELFNKIYTDVIGCYAYYVVQKNCAPEAIKEASDKYYIGQLNHLDEIASKVATVLESSQEEYTSRIKASYDESVKLMNKECSKIAVVYSRYGSRCKILGGDIDTIVKEYVKELSK